MASGPLSWAMAHSPLSGRERLVHLYIGDIVNDQNDYLFWMSQKTCGAYAGCSPDTVGRTIKKLIELDCLELVRTHESGTNQYRWLQPALPLNRPTAKCGTPSLGVPQNAEGGYRTMREGGTAKCGSGVPHGAEQDSKVNVKGNAKKNTKEEEDPNFTKFYDEIYPRRCYRGPAAKVWNARIAEGVPAEQLLEAAENFAGSMARQRRAKDKIMHPATFLAATTWLEWRPEGDAYREELALQERGGSSESIFAQTMRELRQESA